MSSTPEKICPQCGEGVKPAMLKCPDCGYRFFLRNGSTSVATSQPVMAPRQVTSPIAINRPTRSGPRVIPTLRPSTVGVERHTETISKPEARPEPKVDASHPPLPQQTTKSSTESMIQSREITITQRKPDQDTEATASQPESRAKKLKRTKAASSSSVKAQSPSPESQSEVGNVTRRGRDKMAPVQEQSAATKSTLKEQRPAVVNPTSTPMPPAERPKFVMAQPSRWSQLKSKLMDLVPDTLIGSLSGNPLAIGTSVAVVAAIGLGIVSMTGKFTGQPAHAATAEDDFVSVAAIDQSRLVFWTKAGSVAQLNVANKQVEKVQPWSRSGRFIGPGPQGTATTLIDRKIAHCDVTTTPKAPDQGDVVPMANELPQVSGNGQVVMSRIGPEVLTWSLAQHKALAKFVVNPSVRAVISHDGQTVLAITRDGIRLVLLSVETGEELGTLLPKAQKVTELALSPDGRRAFINNDHQGMVIDVESGEVRKINGGSTIPNPQFLNSEVLVGASGLNVYRLNLQDGKVNQWLLNGRDEQLSQLLPVEGGQKLAAFGTDDSGRGRAWLLELSSGRSDELKLN